MCPGLTNLATDGSRAKKVARVHVAARNGVVCQLLLKVPVEVLFRVRGQASRIGARRLECIPPSRSTAERRGACPSCRSGCPPAA
jgi:hypothetical protein